MGLRNFSPKEFINSEGNDPKVGTRWRSWMRGEEPTISRAFALVMWESLTEAEYGFVSPFNEWNPPDRYRTSVNGLTVAVSNIENDMNAFFSKIQLNMLRMDRGLLHPYDFNAAYYDDEHLGENKIKTMSAYSIYCHDFAISGLLERQANQAAIGYAFAVIALGVCREYKNQFESNSDLHKLIRSDIARKNAQKRHKTTWEEEAKVVSHWQLNINPALSIDKAAATLMSVFPKLTYNTLRKYVSAAKRRAKHTAS